jgi:CrcB protein
MPTVVAVATGGALGAVSATARPTDRAPQLRPLPLEHIHDQHLGLLLIGVVIAALVDRHQAPGWLRVGLVVAVLGGYTTFSTFAQETLDLLRSDDVAVALLYSPGSLVTGVLAVMGGTMPGRAL